MSRVSRISQKRLTTSFVPIGEPDCLESATITIALPLYQSHFLFVCLTSDRLYRKWNYNHCFTIISAMFVGLFDK